MFFPVVSRFSRGAVEKLFCFPMLKGAPNLGACGKERSLITLGQVKVAGVISRLVSEDKQFS